MYSLEQEPLAKMAGRYKSPIQATLTIGGRTEHPESSPAVRWSFGRRWITVDALSFPRPLATSNAQMRSLHRADPRMGRGLRRSSLFALLAKYRHIQRHVRRPQLTPAEILSRADAHHERMGKWPRATSGPILEAPGETWQPIHAALVKGRRGLPGAKR
jgi:hypothetical protein